MSQLREQLLFQQQQFQVQQHQFKEDLLRHFQARAFREAFRQWLIPAVGSDGQNGAQSDANGNDS